MKINSIYNNINDISIESYLSYYGVKNPIEYMKGMEIEDNNHCDNIDDFCKELRGWLGSTDNIYLLVDS